MAQGQWGRLLKLLGREVSDRRTTGRFYVAVVQAVGVQDVGTDPLSVENPRGCPPLGGTSDDGHGPQKSTGWDMGVLTHWGGAGNGGSGQYQGVYLPPPEHGRTVHCNSYYHVLVSGGGAEAGTTYIQAMVGAPHSRYPGDKSGECRSGGRGGESDRGIRWRGRGREG